MTTIEVNMKIYHLFIIFFWAILPNVICALEFVAITELDYKLSCSDVPAAISRYMEDNSLDKSQMLELLNKNLHEQLSATDWDEGSKITAAEGTLQFMAGLGESQALPYMLKYAERDYPDDIRATASMLYIRHAGDAGFVIATNVMIQPWRTFREHGRVRVECYAQAKSRSQEAGKKYIDFMKWAILHAEGATSSTIDDHLYELDPYWRTNEIRFTNAIRLLNISPNETATNDSLRILHDYEIAVGLRQSDSKAEQQTSSEPTDADIGNVPVLDVQSNTAQTPVPVSRTSIVLVLGVVIIASFIVYLIWKSRFK
jgi:hypothetical protein